MRHSAPRLLALAALTGTSLLSGCGGSSPADAGDAVASRAAEASADVAGDTAPDASHCVPSGGPCARASDCCPVCPDGGTDCFVGCSTEVGASTGTCE
jgi:hypothetical protein